MFVAPRSGKLQFRWAINVISRANTEQAREILLAEVASRFPLAESVVLIHPGMEPDPTEQESWEATAAALAKEGKQLLNPRPDASRRVVIGVTVARADDSNAVFRDMHMQLDLARDVAFPDHGSNSMSFVGFGSA